MVTRSSPLPFLPRVLFRFGAFAALLAAQFVSAQAQNASAPLVVTTLAGQAGTSANANGTGTAAGFSSPTGLAVLPNGDVVLTDAANNVFRRVTAAGVVTVFSGRPTDNENFPINVGSADGAASDARFNIGVTDGPVGSYTLAMDSSGNVYFADTLNNTIRKLGPDGTASTIAGAAGQTGVADGTGADARFLVPGGVARDSSGNLYVADSGNNTIRKITPAGVVTTFAGVGRTFGSTDGTGTAARFLNPSGIVADSAGNLFVTDSGNHTIRKITPAGVVTTFAGVAGSKGTSDGSGTLARFNDPTAIAIDGSGNLYVADSGNHTIRRITATGAVSTIAGSPGNSGPTDGTGIAARFDEPQGIAVSASGVVYVADTGNHTLRHGTFQSGAGTPTLTVSSQPQRQQVVQGNAATFKVVATGTPSLTYQWQKAGVNIAGATNATYTIAAPAFADSGFYTVVVTAGTISFTSTPAQLQVFPTGTPIPPIVVLAQSTDQIVNLGQPATFFVEVTGVTSPTYQWKKDGNAISGATSATYTIPAVQSSDAGLYTVTITDGSDSTTTIGSQLTVTSTSAIAPLITTQPAAQTAGATGSVSFTVAVTGTPAPSFQWKHNGTPLADGSTGTGSSISGATTATLSITNIGTSDAGDYTVLVSNIAGSITSNPATLTIGAVAAAPTHIVNLSVLTSVASANDSFTMGYVVGGSGTSGAKPLIIRAAGPSLAALGVPGTLNDPKMELFVLSTKTGENNDWGGAEPLRVAMAAVGAFSYTGPTSLDAAVATDITSRDNSVKVSSNDGSTGQVIAEVYDATPNDTFTATTPRLINVSVLKQIGGGFTIGFVIRGSSTCKVLVRGVGPGLAPLGVPGTVPDPQITLFRRVSATDSIKVDENNDWGSGATLADTFHAVGAFDLPADSKDAALVATLEPADYTVEIKDVNDAQGTALIEVYEVP